MIRGLALLFVAAFCLSGSAEGPAHMAMTGEEAMERDDTTAADLLAARIALEVEFLVGQPGSKVPERLWLQPGRAASLSDVLAEVASAPKPLRLRLSMVSPGEFALEWNTLTSKDEVELHYQLASAMLAEGGLLSGAIRRRPDTTAATIALVGLPSVQTATALALEKWVVSYVPPNGLSLGVADDQESPESRSSIGFSVARVGPM